MPAFEGNDPYHHRLTRRNHSNGKMDKSKLSAESSIGRRRQKGDSLCGASGSGEKSRNGRHGASEKCGKLLPLAKGSRLALFGKGVFDYVKGGGGSGDVTVLM